MVVVAITGVVYVLFVCPAIRTPALVYHRYCPAVPPEAVRVTAEDPQAEFPVIPGAAGGELIVAVTDVFEPSQVPSLIETE